MRPCPNCSKQIKDDAELCKFCLLPVGPTAQEEQSITETVSQARAAREAGARLFQVALPLSQTLGFIKQLSGTASGTRTIQHAGVLESVEGEGWHLEHVNYVYRMTGTVSRDKFFSTGQQEAVSGEIVGVYLFRRPMQEGSTS